jgi:hypothetical protein
MSEVLLKVSDRADAFIASLEQGDENEYVRGLGVPGPYRKKHWRRALREGLVVIHPSGKGLCWAYAGAIEKVERVFNYEDHAPADPAATKRLLAEFARLQVGVKKQEPEPVAAGVDP